MIRELNLLLEMDADMPDATISIKPRRSDDQVNHHGDLDQLDDLEKHKGEDDKEETEEKGKTKNLTQEILFHNMSQKKE